MGPAAPSDLPCLRHPGDDRATSWKSRAKMGRGTAIYVTLLGRAEREERRRTGLRIEEGSPPAGEIPAPAAGGVPQVVGCGAPAVITASTLLLGADSCVRTARGLGPSAPSSSAGLALCVGTVRGPGPASSGRPGMDLRVRVSRDMGPSVPGPLDPDLCVRTSRGVGPSGTG